MEVCEVSAFNAFQNQLKTLCLTEFPCGTGSWRDKKITESGTAVQSVETHFAVTHKDFGADNEKTETLEELVKSKHSPWNLDYSWSNEARRLREIAVRSPWLIDDSFILSHFKTLRIVDKQVTEVDDGLLNFKNLEELTLSTNCIQALNSSHLPRSLKVLELCANQISDLFSLCVKPPSLTHLGLAYNKILFIDDYITGDYWPELLSLDLSRNNLSDLMEVVRKLATLPKLRNLVLQGNPLSLVPGYRGFTVDTLKELSYLDDVGITADERHHFKGLAKKKEYILDEAKLVFRVGYIKNIVMPEELKFPEEQPEFPQVTRNYYAQFKFMKDNSSKAEIFQITYDEYSPDHTERAMSEALSHSARSDKGRSVVSSGIDNGMDVEKNVNFAKETETIKEVEPDEILTDRTPEGKDQVDNEEHSERIPWELTDIKSSKGNWAEELVLDWSMLVVRDDLLKLRDFLIQGMEVQVMEEKILAYPKEDFANPDGTSPAGSQRSGKGDKKEKGKKDDKAKRQHRSTSRRRSQSRNRSQSRSHSRGRQRKPSNAQKRTSSKTPERQSARDRSSSRGRSLSRGRSSNGKMSSQSSAKDDKGKKDGKGKGKKKEPEVEMHYMPAELTCLATFHIPLEDFLHGEYIFENVFVEPTENATYAASPVSIVKRKSRKSKLNIRKSKSMKKSDDKGKKREKSAEKKDKDKKERNKSPKGKEKDAKGDKSKAGNKEAKKDQIEVTGEEEDLPPPPLELKVSVELQHWTTAHDALRRDEDESEARGASP